MPLVISHATNRSAGQDSIKKDLARVDKDILQDLTMQERFSMQETGVTSQPLPIQMSTLSIWRRKKKNVDNLQIVSICGFIKIHKIVSNCNADTCAHKVIQFEKYIGSQLKKIYSVFGESFLLFRYGVW